MISERAYVTAAAATYTSDPTWVGGGIAGSIHALRTEIDGLLVIAFRGSISPLDWALDFLGGATVDFDAFQDLRLGLVHDGFATAVRSIFPKISVGIGDRPYALVGHSLGGALALLSAGRMICQFARPPVAIRTYGAPRVGMWLYVQALKAVDDLIQYRYGQDPVPAVPTWFKHARGLTNLAAAEELTPVTAYHHIENYVAALSGGGVA